MIAFASLLFMAIPVLLLSLGFLAKPIPNTNYDVMANKKAASIYFKTGTYPTSVNVMGVQRTPNVTMIESNISNPYSSNLEWDIAVWKKSNIEQALSGICNQIMNKCNTTDLALLFAFMEQSQGTVDSLLQSTTPTTTTLNCNSTVPADYAAYGLYLLQQSVVLGDVSVNMKYINHPFYYNKPTGGVTGCFYVDMVNIGA